MRIGVIGAGAVARRSHLPAWCSLGDEAHVVALAETHAPLARKVAAEFQIPRWEEDYGAILADPAVELVDVCTPTPTHFEIATRALAAGKHVLLEKPLALSLAETLTIYQQAEEAQRGLCVVQNYRYMDVVRAARARLSAGALGEVASIYGEALTRFPSSWTLNTWLYHPRAVLYDFTPHLIDLVIHLKEQPVRRVHAVGRECGPDAPFLVAAQLLLEFEDQSTALLDTSWLGSAFSFAVNLHGTGGSCYLEPMKEVFREVHGSITPLDDVTHFLRKLGNTLWGVASRSYFTKPLRVYVQFFRDFTASLNGQAPMPVRIEQSVWTMLILDAAWESIRSGRPVETAELLAAHSLPSGLVDRLWNGCRQSAPA
jgi:predicted dehydrogenase